MTDATFDKLKSNFPDAVQSSQTFRDETTITVAADRLPEDWFEVTSRCDGECIDCTYCAEVLEKILVDTRDESG